MTRHRLFLCFIVVSCLSLFTIGESVAAPELSESKAKPIIEEGMKQNYIFNIPIGIVWIQPGMLTGSKTDPTKHEYAAVFEKTLEAYSKSGLITLNNAGMGGIHTKYEVSITAKGKQMSSGQKDNGDYFIKVAEIRIGKIVQNTDYRPGQMGSTEYKLIMGVYDFIPTRIGEEIYMNMGEVLNKQYKFRALLEYDPFKEGYIFVVSDWGYLDKDGFVTDWIK